MPSPLTLQPLGPHLGAEVLDLILPLFFSRKPWRHWKPRWSNMKPWYCTPHGYSQNNTWPLHDISASPKFTRSIPTWAQALNRSP